jgi:hypothetical protein
MLINLQLFAVKIFVMWETSESVCHIIFLGTLCFIIVIGDYFFPAIDHQEEKLIVFTVYGALFGTDIVIYKLLDTYVFNS